VNKTFKRVFFGAVVAYLVFQIFVFNTNKKARFHEKIIVVITAPFQSALSGIIKGSEKVVSSYLGLWNQKKNIKKMEKELSQWRQDTIYSKELALENIRLRKILNIKMTQDHRRVVARRIAYGSSRFEQSIRIQKGQRHGLQEGYAVISADGLIGQIIKVYWGHADVLLITDPSSSVDVIVQRSRENAMLKGGSGQRLAFEYLDKSADVTEGDTVITSGLDGIYPKGFPIGRISAVGQKDQSLFLEASVEPFVDFYQIEEVVVLIPQDPVS